MLIALVVPLSPAFGIEERTTMVSAGGHDEGTSRAGISKVSVKRDRLLRELDRQGREAGITFICASRGMGKTSLLMQYADAVREDPTREDVRIWDGAGLDAERFASQLDGLMRKGGNLKGSLLAVDDIPLLHADGISAVAERLRELRTKGLQVVMTCSPDNQALMAAMGDSYKLGGQALLVSPQEYGDWARALAIASSLDVYGMTKGVPLLVSMLQVVSGKIRGKDGLDRAAAELYGQAIASFRRDRDPLHRIACLMVLMGTGSLADLGRLGVRVRSEAVERLVRDYPIFGMDLSSRTFSCLGGGAAFKRLRKEIAGNRPEFAMKAARVLVVAGREDEAVALANEVFDASQSLELIAAYPDRLVLSGNAAFIQECTGRLHGAEALDMHIGCVLGVYLSGLVLGDYRLARGMCAELRRRAKEIETEIDPDAWRCARALSSLWGGFSGASLPEVSNEYLTGAAANDTAKALLAHREAYAEVVQRMRGVPRGLLAEIEVLQSASRPSQRCDIAQVLLRCDVLLNESLHDEISDVLLIDDELGMLAKHLYARHLKPIAARVRMTAAICRMMAGLPIVDERAFIDAGTIAVRESDLATQLFCLLGEGWQALDVNQTVNARFRAQQVRKLVDESQTFLSGWAVLLEQTSLILNTSRMTLSEEAELLDLTQPAGCPAQAWAVTLKLSAAHRDAELSAWFSAHKERLLQDAFRPLAAQAMAAVGERANSIRMLLPERVADRYVRGDAGKLTRMYESERIKDVEESVGQICVRLFGGFCVERNGHRLTDAVWKRKKSSVLAARLVLSMGSFVSRKVLTEELWPELEYGKARANLYVVISALRTALCQRANGPQYVVAQGDGLALNDEYVTSDTARFDMLARDVLLKRSGTSGRQIIEACLKLDELYTGPLYIPDVGDTSFFVHMRHVYLNKFLDCMMRGVDIAMEMDDLPSASWLVESAMKQAPLREDVIRRAMHVYDKGGRRREVVELYTSHLHYLEHELNAVPEEETRLAYESIISRAKVSEML